MANKWARKRFESPSSEFLFAVEGDLGIVGYVVTIDTFGFVIKIVFVNSPIVLYPCEIEEGSLLFLFLRLVPFAFPLAIYIFDFLFIYFFCFLFDECTPATLSSRRILISTFSGVRAKIVAPRKKCNSTVAVQGRGRERDLPYCSRLFSEYRPYK